MNENVKVIPCLYMCLVPCNVYPVEKAGKYLVYTLFTNAIILPQTRIGQLYRRNSTCYYNVLANIVSGMKQNIYTLLDVAILKMNLIHGNPRSELAILRARGKGYIQPLDCFIHINFIPS